MDNQYACASLFVLLRENFDILCAGTTRTNRVGWPKDNMTMSKSAARGTTIRDYDHQNHILCVQSMDNKVVSLTSSLNISGDTPVNRRSGLNVLALTMDKWLEAYQQRMDGVDKSNQYRERGAGFASKAHCKKWYKKAFLLFWISWFSIPFLFGICL